MEIKIQDESGDRKYFTIIPNYILNHSTMWDREVYVQMKRITGEEGTCWTSQKTLAKQCGISVNRLKKSLKYLVEHKWIKQIGVKKVNTKGGAQEVNEYKVADLWKLNMEYYESLKGVSPDATPIPQGVSPKELRGITVEAQGVSPESYKEEPVKEYPIKEEPLAIVPIAGDISKVINLFKDIDSSYKEWFGNTTERKACEKLLIRAPLEKLEQLMVQILPVLNSMPYNSAKAKAFKPSELNRNWSAIMAKIKEKQVEIKERSEKNKMTILR